MLVSIIGLAFIVTIAGFLVAASDEQDTSRLASAKVDVATREDALMQELLQQTAKGMLPGTDGIVGTPALWSTIMGNAITNLDATTYASTAELGVLQTAGAIPTNAILANTGDTGQTPISVFQLSAMYASGEPYGGTSGVLNVLPTATYTQYAAVLPPLMNWFGGSPSTLSSATALTTPQEFFLGSLFTAGVTASVLKLSASYRWGEIYYPNVRFGYKQAGNFFISRHVWWRIPVLYQTTQQTLEDQTSPTPVSRFPGSTANYDLSVYEIPSQLPISGNANLQIGLYADGTSWGGQIGVTGSIYGGQIQLYGRSYAGVSSRNQVTVQSPATVGGTPYSNSAFDAVGTRETLALSQTPGAAAPGSVAVNDGKVLMVPVMPGNQFYMNVAAPTHWDLYARPYYRCRVRIIISGTDSTIIYSPSQTPETNTAAGAITVTLLYSADTNAPPQPDQILGFPDIDATQIVYEQLSYGDTTKVWPTTPNWMSYTSTATGDRNLLVIDVGQLLTALAGSGTPAQFYSIYIGSHPLTEPASASTSSDPGIAITNTHDLSACTSGLSIVTNQTLYLLDSFNQGATQPPTSIYAPQVRYGMSGALANVTLTGQLSVDPISTTATPPVDPLSVVNAFATPVGDSQITGTFTEITDPTKIPPITRLSLMFTIERERTN